MVPLTTTRLILRPFSLEDASNVFVYAQDPQVCIYTSWEPHQSEADSLVYVEQSIREQAQHPLSVLAVTLKTQPETVIGAVGLRPDASNPYALEFAYAIARPYWGQGIVLEACQVLLENARSKQDLKRIWGSCIRENVASAKILQKLGLEYEGCLRAKSYCYGRFWDLEYYGLLLK